MKTLLLITWLVFAALWIFVGMAEWRTIRRKQRAGKPEARFATTFVEQLAVGVAATATGSTVLSVGFFGSVAALALLIVGIIIRTVKRRSRITT